MKLCTHSHQMLYSVIPWLCMRWRYLYYLQTFSLGTFQTYCATQQSDSLDNGIHSLNSLIDDVDHRIHCVGG